MPVCPRCSNVLREVLVTTSKGTRTTIEACLDGCTGIWVGREDLAAGLQPAMSDELVRVQQGSTQTPDTRWEFLEVDRARRRGPKIVLTPEQIEQYIRCVRCGQMMNRYRWNMTSQVILDECPQGHGIWFDAGEIMQMRQALQADVVEPGTRDDLRARLAQARLEYESRTPRDTLHRRESPFSWLFGILFDSDWD